MVQQKHIKHENVFSNWNRYRLSEISSNTLTFNVIEKDREIYNKFEENSRKCDNVGWYIFEGLKNNTWLAEIEEKKKN